MSYPKNLGAIRIAILFLILANIIWGAGFPIYKWALAELPPFTFAFLRFFIGALILFPFVAKKLKIARQDWRNTFLLAFFGITLLIPFLFLGLQLTPSINAPVIIAVGPILLIGASILFLKETLKLKVLGGTLISLLGIIVIIIHPILVDGFSGGFIGNLLILIATVCGVIQAVLLKKLTVRNNPLTLTFWMFLIGSLPLLPFVIWEAQTFNIVADITIKGFMGLAYGIFFAAILAHYFLAYGIQHIKASEVGVFTYVDPIATVLVAVPLLEEAITFPYLAGAMLVFLGIFIAEGRLHYHPLHKLFNREKGLIGNS